MSTGSHEAWAEQDIHRRGWTGHFQTDKGVKTVCGVGQFRRCALIFATKEEAERRADKALIAHLVANPRPRSSGAKTFSVARNGRNVRTISLPRT